MLPDRRGVTALMRRRAARRNGLFSPKCAEGLQPRAQGSRHEKGPCDPHHPAPCAEQVLNRRNGRRPAKGRGSSAGPPAAFSALRVRAKASRPADAPHLTHSAARARLQRQKSCGASPTAPDTAGQRVTPDTELAALPPRFLKKEAEKNSGFLWRPFWLRFSSPLTSC